MTDISPDFVQETEQPPEAGFVNRWQKLTKQRRLIAILAALIALTLFVILLLKITWPVPPSAPVLPTRPPLPIIAPTPISSPSLYATDSAVLKIEDDLGNIETDLQTTDLKESSLMPPSLDWEVTFE